MALKSASITCTSVSTCVKRSADFAGSAARLVVRVNLLVLKIQVRICWLFFIVVRRRRRRPSIEFVDWRAARAFIKNASGAPQPESSSTSDIVQSAASAFWERGPADLYPKGRSPLPQLVSVRWSTVAPEQNLTQPAPAIDLSGTTADHVETRL